jgi:hypothetical protein
VTEDGSPSSVRYSLIERSDRLDCLIEEVRALQG